MAMSKSRLDLYEQAVPQYREGRFGEAAQLLSEEIVERPTSEAWNDWAATQRSLGQFRDGERGFRKALRLNPENGEAAGNPGAILFAQGKKQEAVAQKALEHVSPEGRGLIEKMLSHCMVRKDGEVSRRESVALEVSNGKRYRHQGWWITFLWQMTEQLGLRRRIYGLTVSKGRIPSTTWRTGRSAIRLLV
jgi:tetratricopeptide (TPR) repeat protein